MHRSATKFTLRWSYRRTAVQLNIDCGANFVSFLWGFFASEFTGIDVKKLQREFDAEGGAAANLGGLDKDAAFVVLLDDTLGERETQPPPSCLRRIARFEDTAET